MGQCESTLHEGASFWPSDHNSSKILENCLEVKTPHPKVVKYLSANGTKRIVEEVEMGLGEILFFLNFAFSAAFRTKSELIHEEDKHDFFKPEAMTRSMAVSSLWTSLPRAMMSPGRDMSFLR